MVFIFEVYMKKSSSMFYIIFLLNNCIQDEINVYIFSLYLWTCFLEICFF